MKSAYLIIAHDNFLVLQYLLSALDSPDVDIYVHIDGKVSDLPALSVCYSNLIVLKNRLDVRWGDVSQIETELLLWETAHSNGPYSHYHLISGTHYPLKPISEIRMYFNLHKEKNIFSPLNTNRHEIDCKIRRLNFFTRTYKHNKYCISGISKLCWLIFHRLQKVIQYRRYTAQDFYKASNWCSLSEQAVCYLLANKTKLINKYKYTFCGDEYFAVSELMNSHLREQVVFRDDILKQEWVSTHPKIYMYEDFDDLMSSECLFARKFSCESLDVLLKIRSRIRG